MRVEYYGFEWDSEKNEANKKKYGISFETASRVFNDPCLLEKFDASHSSRNEERYASIGLLDGILILFVSHTDRNGKTRIISARKAVGKEVKEYERHRKSLQAD